MNTSKEKIIKRLEDLIELTEETDPFFG